LINIINIMGAREKERLPSVDRCIDRLVEAGCLRSVAEDVVLALFEALLRRRASDRERVRRWRAQKRCNVTSPDMHNVTLQAENPRKIKKLDGCNVTRNVTSDGGRNIGDLFEAFWREYPKREGPNPKAPAKKKFLALIASGEDADRIIEGARRCREDHSARNEIRTRYVAQAVTWLNQRRWEDYLAIAPTGSADAGPPVPPDPSMPSDDELRERYAHVAPESAQERPVGNQRHREYAQMALDYLRQRGRTEGSNIRPGTAEWTAWRRYFRDRWGFVPVSMLQVENSESRTMSFSVPEPWPEWFDASWSGGSPTRL
jgi:hypothetical protein